MYHLVFEWIPKPMFNCQTNSKLSHQSTRQSNRQSFYGSTCIWRSPYHNAWLWNINQLVKPNRRPTPFCNRQAICHSNRQITRQIYSQSGWKVFNCWKIEVVFTFWPTLLVLFFFLILPTSFMFDLMHSCFQLLFIFLTILIISIFTEFISLLLTSRE